jgi:hypothetical protein
VKSGTFGEANLAAVIGSSIGSVTSLFAIGVAPAIIESDARLLLAFPTISLFLFVLGGIAGWLMGGLLGRRLAKPQRMQRAHVTGGLIGGAVPFVAFVLLGWLIG